MIIRGEITIWNDNEMNDSEKPSTIMICITSLNQVKLNNNTCE